MTDLELACRAALRNHDALQAAYEAEPTPPDDGPIQEIEWLDWCENIREPAYAKWSLSMELLQRVAGDAFPGRHPHNFRPFCQMVLAAPESFAGPTP